jgi:hypothetical protein
MIDTDYDGESFFVRHCYFIGGQDPYTRLKKALRACPPPCGTSPGRGSSPMRSSNWPRRPESNQEKCANAC